MFIAKVFISYAHDTEQFADKVLELSNELTRNNIDANIDQYDECQIKINLKDIIYFLS